MRREGEREGVCVFVCVCEREREREYVHDAVHDPSKKFCTLDKPVTPCVCQARCVQAGSHNQDWSVMCTCTHVHLFFDHTMR